MKTPSLSPPILSGVALASLVAAYFLGTAFSNKSPSKAGAPAQKQLSERPTSLLNRSVFRTESNQTIADRVLATIAKLERLRTPAEFRQALGEILSYADKTEKERLVSLLFASWLDRDPEAAFAEARRVEFLRYHAGRTSRSFSQWAETNPIAAASLLEQTLDGRQLTTDPRPPYLDGVDPPEFLLSLVNGLAQTNPRLAADTLAAAEASPVQIHALEVLMQTWFPADSEEVFAWTSSLSNPEVRSQSLAIVATKAGQLDDPSAGLSWAQNLKDSEEQTLALGNLVSQWSQRYSQDAFNWIAALSDSNLKFQLMPPALRQLTLINPGAAADWLNQYEASPQMDASIAAYVKSIQTVNPEAARGSASAITDPHLREQILQELAQAAP
ncbi:hypothetical protein [Roseibacillus persicicus]|uniref:hypothetical protein n=1 Tax=Roseibacillus persicicus TaxID=454148 RepID=UPI00280EFDD8|nr:hypothetical protein [Roseibacillus persicicus]MDQ8191411.1 hypothetical protein [Roseibacillus persicicus]